MTILQPEVSLHVLGPGLAIGGAYTVEHEFLSPVQYGQFIKASVGYPK